MECDVLQIIVFTNLLESEIASLKKLGQHLILAWYVVISNIRLLSPVVFAGVHPRIRAVPA